MKKMLSFTILLAMLSFYGSYQVRTDQDKVGAYNDRFEKCESGVVCDTKSGLV